jgi:hypothetical protein
VLCSLAASDSQAIGKHHGIDRTGTRRSNALNDQLIFLEEAIEHAPSEGAMGASPLKSQVNRFLPGDRRLELRMLGRCGRDFAP